METSHVYLRIAVVVMILLQSLACSSAEIDKHRATELRGALAAEDATERNEIHLIDFSTVSRDQRTDNRVNLLVHDCQTLLITLLKSMEEGRIRNAPFTDVVRERIPRVHDYYTSHTIPDATPAIIECYGVEPGQNDTCVFLLPIVESRELSREYVAGFNKAMLSAMLAAEGDCEGVTVETD